MNATMTTRHFLKIIFDHTRLIVVILAVINGGVIAYNLIAPKVYQSTSRIYVERAAEDLAIMQKARPFADPPSAEQLLSTESEIITSYPVLLAALKSVRGKQPSNLEVELLRQNIQVVPVNKANILAITLQDKDPLEAATLLNELVSRYRMFRGTIRSADSTRQYLDKQLNAMRASMDSLYQLQNDLVSSHGVADYENSMRLLNQSIYDLEADLRSRHAKAAELSSSCEHLQTELEGYLNDPNRVLAVPENWILTRSLIQQLEEARIQLEQMNQQYLPGSVELMRKNNQVKDLQEQVVQSMQAQLRDLRRQAAQDQKVIQKAEADLLQKRSQLLAIPEIQSRYQSTQTALNSLNELMDEINKIRMAQGVGGLSIEDVSVSLISPAFAPRTHTYPHTWQNLLLGLVTSLIVALAITYLVESLDSSIKFSDDLEALDIQYLTGFPQRK